jgi:hypothetical protein
MKTKTKRRGKGGAEGEADETNLYSTLKSAKSNVKDDVPQPKKISTDEFLKLVWPDKLLTHETLELRAKQRTGGAMRSEFARSITQFLERTQEYGEGWDVYFGVATRFRNGGKKHDCYRVHTVWTDLDDRELAECTDFNPKPDILVTSGGGVHAYWLLSKPLLVNSNERWCEIESINRGLARKFKADLNTIDIARILRVPGLMNYKYNPSRPVEAYAL